MLKIKAFSKFTAFLGIGVNIGIVQVFAVMIPDLAQITTMHASKGFCWGNSYLRSGMQLLPGDSKQPGLFMWR
jgi:hypothetical protein